MTNNNDDEEKEKGMIRDFTIAEIFNCRHCKKDFVINTIEYNIPDAIYQMYRDRQDKGMNPPFDTGSDLTVERMRGL